MNEKILNYHIENIETLLRGLNYNQYSTVTYKSKIKMSDDTYEAIANYFRPKNIFLSLTKNNSETFISVTDGIKDKIVKSFPLASTIRKSQIEDYYCDLNVVRKMLLDSQTSQIKSITINGLLSDDINYFLKTYGYKTDYNKGETTISW